MRINDDQLQRLLTHGSTVIPSFLTPTELAAARENLLRYVPSAEELRDQPERYAFVLDDPEHLQTEFPFAGDALNYVSTHPDIVAAVRTLLGVNDVLLSQAAIWAKYAGTGDFEQGLHLDYQGNTLVVPRDDSDYRQVNMILYYSDVTQDMGPTYVVNQLKTANLPLWPTHRPRRRNADLYEHERPLLANAGDLLIFGMRAWHRASDITAAFGARFSHHLVYRSARHGFQGYHHWPRFGESEHLTRFVERCTVQQRSVLGFPKPGDAYWTPETLAAVQLRYPTMDLTPYRA